MESNFDQHSEQEGKPLPRLTHATERIAEAVEHGPHRIEMDSAQRDLPAYAIINVIRGVAKRWLAIAPEAVVWRPVFELRGLQSLPVVF